MTYLITATYVALFAALFDWASIGFRSHRFYIRCGLGVAMAIFGLGRILFGLPLEEYIVIAGQQFSPSSAVFGLMEFSVGVGLIVSRYHQRVVQLCYITIIATLFTTNSSNALGNWLWCPIYKSSCDASLFSHWNSIEQTTIIAILLLAVARKPLQRTRGNTTLPARNSLAFGKQSFSV